MQKSLRIFLLLFGLSAFHLLQAQGILKGVVKDSTTKEAIIGANVVIEGTTNGSSTDVEGNFTIFNIPAGKYNLIVSSIGYRPKKITDIQITAGKELIMNFDLAEDVAQLGTVQIVAARETAAEIAVIQEIKLSQQVISGISAEQISRSQDRDAAQALSRIPGITVVDGRFVMVRGIGERYNNVMINGIIAPSTEIDNRTFSFDLIPSTVMDRMLVFKSGSSELPGDFAGGMIKIFTQNTVTDNVTTFTIGTGVRAGTTFQDFTQSKGSGTDFLGFDNGFRALPSSFPSNLLDFPSSSPVVFNAARSLKNNFEPITNNALPDLRLGARIGRKFRWGNAKVSTLTILNYSNTSQSFQSELNRFTDFDRSVQRSPVFFAYNNDNHNRNVRVGIIHNWNFNLNANNKIEFRNMFNQLGDNETIIRRGTLNQQRPSDEFLNYSYRYLSRSIYSGQIQGTHSLNDKFTLTWVTGLNYVNRNEPDWRRFRSVREIGSDNAYRLIDPPSSNLFDLSRFYSKLTEYSVAGSVNTEYKFGKDEQNPAVLRVGGYIEYKSRDFSARYVSYILPTGGSQDLLQRPLGDTFIPENIGSNGFTMGEGTNVSDKYDGNNLLTAGYAGLTLPLDAWNVSFGSRIEYNRQRLNGFTQSLQRVRVNNPITSLMPFLNVSYNFNEKNVVRFAYSRTINRPEFRELAPFLFYDFNLDANIIGNPNLRVANIDNLDLRYEFYPTPGETISFGAFYKYFNNPIESNVVPVADGQQYSYQNAALARNYGIELEIRKNFNFIGGNFWDKLSLVANGSLINSKVDLGTSQVLAQDRERALQGQSPYIINTGLYYIDEKKGWNVSALYNIFGPRIFLVGSDNQPTIYEMPRHQIDLTVSKRLNSRLDLRAGVQDLLNARFRFLQDSDRNAKITGIDESIIRFRRGSYYTMSLTFRL